jgi:hypothetical protein
MTRTWLPVILLCGALCLSSSPAEAHLRMVSPEARYADQKAGPCGRAGGGRSTDKVSTFRPGQTIMVVWDEYIPHPGHFRISFDDDGEDDFVEPACLASCDTRDMQIELDSAPSVLHDGIPHRTGGGIYNFSVQLPDIECDNCTLQVIQFMTDKPPYGNGNDLYYQCIDLVLSADAPDPGPDPDPDPDPTPGTSSGGCSAAGGPGGAAPWLLAGLLAATAVTRRRRARR